MSSGYLKGAVVIVSECCLKLEAIWSCCNGAGSDLLLHVDHMRCLQCVLKRGPQLQMQAVPYVGLGHAWAEYQIALLQQDTQLSFMDTSSLP